MAAVFFLAGVVPNTITGTIGTILIGFTATEGNAMAPAATDHGLTSALNEIRHETVKRLREMAAESRGGSMVYFYMLFEPGVDVVRYVGRTQDVSNRYSQHILNAHKGKSPCAQWVQSLIDDGDLPRIEIIGGVAASGMANILAWQERASHEVERLLVNTIANTSHSLFSGYEFDLLNVEHTR